MAGSACNPAPRRKVRANAAPSALMASQAVRKKILDLAARALGAELADLQLDNGRVEMKGGNRRAIDFAELARMAQGFPGFSFALGETPGLEHTAYFTPPQAAYCNGSHVAEVEVDIETGAVRILNYAVA